MIKSAETRKASNKNVCTDLELTGDFWKMYSDYFDYFCQIFSVDKTRTKSVSRMDVCMDIAGLDTNDAFNRFRKKIDE